MTAEQTRFLPLVVLVAVALSLFVFRPAQASAVTQVSGTATSDSPLVIDPASEPTDAETESIYIYNGQVLMFIQNMPVTKLVNEVTFGDLARQPGCAKAAYQLTILRSPTGVADLNKHISLEWQVTSVEPIVFPEEPAKVTWKIPPTIFEEGIGYSFFLVPKSSKDSGCLSPKITTWVHNQQKVNGGQATCDSLYPGVAFRMWHTNGQSDAVACPTNKVPSGLDSTMPTGWLRVRSFNNVPYIPLLLESKQCDSGEEKVYWKIVEGSKKYVCRWTLFSDWGGEEPVDGWYYVGGGKYFREDKEFRDVFLELKNNNTSLASYYKPLLYFDTSESWRPLDLSSFFDERYSSGESEIPRHEVCVDGVSEEEPNPECAGVVDPSELMAENNNVEDARLDVEGLGSNSAIEEYLTPGCSTTVELWDCVGASSAIYWRLTPAEPTEEEPDPYRYLQYWMFYRVNSFSDAVSLPDSRHEGDWEAVAIAPSRQLSGAFDFASFSQHGSWYSYLRENLYCAGNVSEDCGTNETPYAGVSLKVFPANGSHANYGTKCSEGGLSVCWQNGLLPERGHDGAISWVHNGGPDGLLELPTSNETWTYWKGLWGVEGGPKSPGRQDAFSISWGECADGNEGCFGSAPARASAKVSGAGVRRPIAGRRMIKGPYAQGCESWFGGGVAALLCEPDRLGSAVGRSGLGTDTGMRVVVEPADTSSSARAEASESPLRSDTALGLSQVVGPPLAPGAALAIPAPPNSPGWRLFIRVVDGERLFEARFDRVKFGSARVVMEEGMPHLELSSGQTLAPAAVRLAG